MKKLIAVIFCAGYFFNAYSNSVISVEFEKDSEKFNEATIRALCIYSEELYLAKGIKVTLQEPSRNADVKKQALFYKREKELREFFKEEHLNFGNISFNYMTETKNNLPVIQIEIVSHAVLAEIIRRDSLFTTKNELEVSCQIHDVELVEGISLNRLTSQEDLYNSNVSSFFENKIILIKELLRIEFPGGKIPNKPVTANLRQDAEDAKKQFILLQWNNVNKEWTKIGNSKKPAKNNRGNYYYPVVIEESGLYTLVESKSGSTTPVVAMAPKNSAMTYTEIISNEPFIRIEGHISDNQQMADFKAPRNIENYTVRAVCMNALGEEWIEETSVRKKSIFSTFRNKKKINAYFN